MDFSYYLPLVLDDGGHYGYYEVSAKAFLRALRAVKGSNRRGLGVDIHCVLGMRNYYLRHCPEGSYSFQYFYN